VARYRELGFMFGFGLFFTFGLLSITSLYAGWPHTFVEAALLGLVGGAAAIGSRLNRGRAGRRRP
jgi:hypothetical protein